MTSLTFPRPISTPFTSIILFTRNPMVEITIAAVVFFGLGFAFAGQM